MNKSVILAMAGVGIAVAGMGVWFFLQNNEEQISEQPEVLGEPAVTIVRTKEGYEPKEVTINKGDIVLWVNQSGDFHWPASDLHPTHGVYPEFDPLRPIASGEEWKFKFDEVGVWKYHDHIRANKTGTITVN
jgi:plastocyanin